MMDEAAEEQQRVAWVEMMLGSEMVTVLGPAPGRAARQPLRLGRVAEQQQRVAKRMVNRGGPYQGPGATPGTTCDISEISCKSTWRKGGKFKREHAGKLCCSKRRCRIFLGVIEDPNAAEEGAPPALAPAASNGLASFVGAAAAALLNGDGAPPAAADAAAPAAAAPTVPPEAAVQQQRVAKQQQRVAKQQQQKQQEQLQQRRDEPRLAERKRLGIILACREP